MTDKHRDEATAIVAQCWCDKRTEHLAMIPSLAEVIIEKVEDLLRENGELREQVAIMKEALEYYGNKAFAQFFDHRGMRKPIDVTADWGAKARKALNGVKP